MGGIGQSQSPAGKMDGFHKHAIDSLVNRINDPVKINFNFGGLSPHG
jgi:hypothetical protein